MGDAQANISEELYGSINEKIRRYWENGLRNYAMEIGVMPDTNESPEIREADSPQARSMPVIDGTPLMRRGFRQARGRSRRSVYTQTQGLIEQLLRHYMDG